jgi:hypothetical protein
MVLIFGSAPACATDQVRLGPATASENSIPLPRERPVRWGEMIAATPVELDSWIEKYASQVYPPFTDPRWDSNFAMMQTSIQIAISQGRVPDVTAIAKDIWNFRTEPPSQNAGPDAQPVRAAVPSVSATLPVIPHGYEDDPTEAPQGAQKTGWENLPTEPSWDAKYANPPPPQDEPLFARIVYVGLFIVISLIYFWPFTIGAIFAFLIGRVLWRAGS